MTVRQVHVVGVALLRDARCLVAQRSEGTSFALRWEFPGGKVEPGEAPHAALVRELTEELGVQVLVGEWLGRGEATSGDVHIALDIFEGSLTNGEPQAIEHRQLRWCSADELGSLHWADADIPVVPVVQRRLRERVKS
ncbi:MAG TPA: (deoxy)nucleoside triphosphate pyrophosphohydrolase [Polyangiaceae bacterium]